MEKPSTKLKRPQILFYGLCAMMIVIAAVSFVRAFSWINKPFSGFLIYNFPYVASMGSREWPGPRAGLKFMERIVSVNEKPVTKGIDVVKLAEEKPLGSPVHYLVESGNQIREIEIFTSRFGLKDFLMVFLVPFVVGLALFGLGCIVQVLKPNTATSWVFFFFCFFVALYMVTGFEMQSTYHFVYLHFFIIPLMPATLLHIGLIFPDRKKFISAHPLSEYVVYVPALVLSLGYMLYLSTFSKSSPSFSWVPHIKDVAALNRSFSLFCVACIMLLLFHSLFRSDIVITRQRARMILFGVTMAFLPCGLIMLLVYFFRISFPWNFLVVFVIFFPASVAYSIVRHNLFDADEIIRRTVGYTVVTLVVVAAYLGVSLTLNVALGKYKLAESRTFPILFTLGVLLVFNPLRNRIQSLVDRLFFRKEYNYRETVQKIGETMRSLLNQDQICRGIMKFALEPMFVDSGSVMILSKDKSEYECFIQADERRAPKRANDGAVKASLKRESVVFDAEIKKDGAVAEAAVEPVKETPELILSVDDPLMRKIAELKKEVTLYDIQEDPLFEAEREDCEQAFERLGATLIVPLIYEDRLSGIISLGQKKSGKFYRREDINLLTTLASQGALALENARMVQEILEKERMRIKIMDAFGKYVTPEVRDQILEGNIPLDGEAKEVTVLFADLRDFTTMAESTTPKEVVRIINGYFSEMADAIGKNKGLVLQFIGDEIEAVFGAPLPLEGHPTHAVRAALAMQRRLAVVNQKLREQGYGPLRHGIGIHTGTVVAANIGSEDRLSYAMVGDTVNLASRIQSLNKQFGTDLLISATTVERLAESLAVEKLPATTVKGKRNPVEVYKLAQTP